MENRVNHPSHYGGDTPYEAIKVIDAWRCNFNTGSAYRYLQRAGHKVSGTLSRTEKEIEDYEKSLWYLKYQLRGVQNGCPTAMQEQPYIVPERYTVEKVVVNAGISFHIEPAARACRDQCSIARLSEGILSLETRISQLQHGARILR